MPRPRDSWAPCLWGSDQLAGTATALFIGGDGEASPAFAFFLLLFFLVPSDAWSPLSLGECFSCFPMGAPLVVVVAAGVTESAPASFLAFFFNFFFFFFASFSTFTGPWMADSWRMSEADTAASRHRCHSSSLSSLLQGEGTEWGQGPRASRKRSRRGRGGGRAVLGSSSLGMRPAWVPTLASPLPSCVISLSDLTSLTLSVSIYEMGAWVSQGCPRSEVSGTR